MPGIRHEFVDPKADGTNETVVRPSDWNAPLQYTDADGVPSGTDAVVRRTLLAAETFYVATTGSDATGTGSVSAPWATLQYATDTISSTLDGPNYVVTVSIADGTYVGTSIGPHLVGRITLSGNTTTPSNVVVTETGDGAVFYLERCVVTLTGMKMTASVSSGASGIHASFLSRLTLGDKLVFGYCDFAHIDIDGAAYVFSDQTYSITGGAGQYHIGVGADGCQAQMYGTYTLSGTPDFGYAFVLAYDNGALDASNATFSGSATGIRYRVETAGMITSGGSLTFFPGNTAGLVDGTGLYDSVQPLASYAKASLPAVTPAGKMIYVTNETGGAVPCFSDGSNWRRVTDRAIVS